MDNKKPLLLIVEDELKIANLLKDYLKEVFSKIKIISDGLEVVEYVDKNLPTFIILDVMLPNIDGFEICKKIRDQHNIPILFLTARTSEIDRILGLQFGADDYVLKPFSAREVVARVQAILKRTDIGKTPDKKLEINGVFIDQNRHQVFIDENEIQLTPTEFDILVLMMNKPNFVFERSHLVSKVMGYEYEGYERNVDAHIKNIRRKIAEVSNSEKIQSIYGVGYKFLSE